MYKRQVQERKGEHFNILNDLRNQGFIRARIDGEIVELDEAPVLELKKKHTIEVIVDRFKIRDDRSTRLAESFETALKLTEGIAVISSLDDDEEALFSARFACTTCGYSISELEPRSFSFNSPKGACSSCDGLGIKQYIDSTQVLHSPDISLAGGAIRGWDKRNMYYFQMIMSLANHYNFDPEASFNSYPEKIQQAILFGSDDESIAFSTLNSRGQTTKRTHPFEGIIPSMERRYRETDSSTVRDELAKYLSSKACPDCQGQRLNEAARHVFINSYTLPAITCLSIRKTSDLFSTLELTGHRGEIAKKIIKEIKARLDFLINVGLDYLSLDRSADTLSGGEAQRIRLASQIGAGLVGVMYVLDEPSIGLHQRDNQRLINTLFHLRDIGNTVIVVEHDEDAILCADHVVDIGPNAGIHGGEIIAQGTPKDIINNPNSTTGQYLSGTQFIAVPTQRNPVDSSKLLRINNARANNLKNITVDIPVGLFTCVTGVSGSGKSTLINETLYPTVAKVLNRSSLPIAANDGVDGLEQLDQVVDIDHSTIGRTPRSNPATYTGLFTPIRELLAATPEARSRGYTPGRFSFNVKGGRCEACQGDGVTKVEMHFLPDIYVPCDVCKGKRYNRETLDIHFKGKNIHQVLDMTIEDARDFFDAIPAIARKLQTLVDVGLSYIKLGQSATTLSGGEAQRVKLSKELSKRDTGKTLYILDEPTTGLHFHDIEQLLAVLHRFRDHGNTVVVIEHNLDVIKTADWVIDLGPEGGAGGGQIIAEGTPEEVSQVKGSHTGQFLKSTLQQ